MEDKGKKSNPPVTVIDDTEWNDVEAMLQKRFADIPEDEGQK